MVAFSRSSSGQVPGLLLQVLELPDRAVAPRDAPHSPEVERFLLSNVDANTIIKILLAPPTNLHHDRVSRRRHWKSATAPGDPSLRSEGLPMGRRRSRYEVDPVR